MVVKAKKHSKKQFKFAVKCGEPVTDGVFDIANFEKFLSDKIKVKGKAGMLGNDVSLERDNASNEVRVVSKIPFSKRYLKYLTKKFLKKNELREYIRIVASEKSSYQLKYFNIQNDTEE